MAVCVHDCVNHCGWYQLRSQHLSARNIVQIDLFFFEPVKSWDGGDNIIDSSKMEGEGKRKERDPWDAELDKGKVRMCQDLIFEVLLFCLCSLKR